MATEQKDDKLGWPSDPKYYQWKGTISAHNGLFNVLAHCKPRKEDVFLKIKQTQDHDSDIDAFTEHTKNLINIQHPNLLTPVHAFVHKSEIWVVYPRHSGGPLIEVLTSHYPNGIPDESIVACILYDTACGLSNLHQQQMCHRNIRASSLHIDIDNGNTLLTNFVQLKEIKWKKAENRRNTMVSPDRQPFTDPLILYGDESASWYAGDIYAFGITALQLTYGQPPPLNLKNLMKNRKGDAVMDLNTITVDVYDKPCPFSKTFELLIKDCCKAQKDRISVNKLLSHKFFHKKCDSSAIKQYFGHILKSTEKRINPSLQSPLTLLNGTEAKEEQNEQLNNGNAAQTIVESNGYTNHHSNIEQDNQSQSANNNQTIHQNQKDKSIDDWSFSTRLSKSDLRKSAIVEELEPTPNSGPGPNMHNVIPPNSYNDPTNLHKFSTTSPSNHSEEKIEALPTNTTGSEKKRKYHVSFSDSAESMSLIGGVEHDTNNPSVQINRFKVEYTELSAKESSRMSQTEEYTETNDDGSGFDPESPHSDVDEEQHINSNETTPNNPEQTTKIARFIISPAPAEHIEVSPEPDNDSQSPPKQQLVKEEKVEIIEKTKWTAKQCSEWVGSLGDKYKQYVDAFVDNGVDGELLGEIEDEELKEIVASGLHRKKILTAWSKLQSD